MPYRPFLRPSPACSGGLPGLLPFLFLQQHFKFKNLTRVLVHLALNNLNGVFWKIILFSRSFFLWQGSYAGWTGCNAVNVVFVLLFTFKFFFAMMAKFLCHPPTPKLSVINLDLHIRKPGAIGKENRQMRAGLFIATADVFTVAFPQKAKKTTAFTSVCR